jgi:hypothetical protein
VTQIISFFAGAALGKSIHGEEVSDIFLRVLNYIGPHNIFFWEHVVDDVVLRHFIMNFVIFLLSVMKFQNC